VKRYVGVRMRGVGRGVGVFVEDVDVLDNVAVTRSELANHGQWSDDFEWGYGGGGPASLARSILWDVFGGQPTALATQAFKWDVVARLERDDDWSLTEPAVRAWAEAWRSKGARFVLVADEDAFWDLDPEFGHQAGAEA
jgi:hypothetical protein